LALALVACGSRAPLAPEGGADAGPVTAAPPIDAGAAEDAGDAGAEEARYDLLLAHGRVIDPASGRDAALRVAITGGRIAKSARSIDPARAASVIDVAGLMVAPGLVDLHVHVFFGAEKNNYLSRSNLAVQADDIAPRSCTTTVVDAGSSGHRTFPIFE